MFSPSGAAVKSIGADKAEFDATGPDSLFTSITGSLWSDLVANDNHGGVGPGEAAATAVTMFHYGDFTDAAAADRAAYLDDNAQLIPINVYTGQLFAR